jgi:hypothetical protein
LFSGAALPRLPVVIEVALAVLTVIAAHTKRQRTAR